MTRHATSTLSDPTPAAPLRFEIAWTALVARDGLGASTNALIDSAAAPGVAAGRTSDGPPVRRLRLTASIESRPGDPGTVRFAAHLEEQGRRRAVGPYGTLPGSITTVGDHIHVVVDAPPAGFGALVDPAAPLLTVVVDTTDRLLMARGRLAEVAGLGPGATGRPELTVGHAVHAAGTAGASRRSVLAE